MQDMYHTKAGIVPSSHNHKTVLVVENNLERGYALVQALKEGTSYRIVFATDTFQALQIIRAVLPDMVLLASRLLDRDGFTLMGRLQASQGGSFPSIVLMDIEKCHEEDAFFVSLVKEFLC